MRRHHVQRAATEIADRRAAAILAARALVEIRYLAGPVRRVERDASPGDDLDRIWFLADLCHNLPEVAQSPAWQPSRKNAPMNSRDRAMAERPMSWVWNTAGPQGRAWILDQLCQAGHDWTPPPPLPTAQARPPYLTMRQRAGLPGRWPVQTPDGRIPLPRQARVLKGLDTNGICALYEEAGRLRLGLGKGGPWLRAHLAPDGTHFVVPDPADYYWPDPNGKIRWWQCTALLRMSDGEQVTGMVAVLPETFTALPSALARRRQHRLVHLARATERDTYLWGRDHKADCSPQRCGYIPEPNGPEAVTR
ncbi:hypothetical protein [Actinopolymorpha alba]|uniref:hypothetical protein n=1 Tax=Actinopolymorpha alba TaxID=533267 RepID=UPI00037EA27E|nr:hypothetical protein [Actinopolymorpha alba]